MRHFIIAFAMVNLSAYLLLTFINWDLLWLGRMGYWEPLSRVFFLVWIYASLWAGFKIAIEIRDEQNDKHIQP